MPHEKTPLPFEQEKAPDEPSLVSLQADESDENAENASGFSRRDFLKTSGVGALASYLLTSACTSEAKEKAPPPSAPIANQILPKTGVSMTLVINGTKRNLVVEPRTTLAEALREKLDMTGTKVICDRGACGGCTVQVNGAPVCSCMMLALDAHEAQVVTIEGLAKGDTLHPLQQAFVECDALQCGYCTPGMVMSCKALLDSTPSPTREQVKEAVAGNLCRCGTYPHVFDATLLAAQRLKK